MDIETSPNRVTTSGPQRQVHVTGCLARLSDYTAGELAIVRGAILCIEALGASHVRATVT